MLYQRELLKMHNYKTIGVTRNVCGGRVHILGRRLEPSQIVLYGLEAIQDFEITMEQYKECDMYMTDYIETINKKKERNNNE